LETGHYGGAWPGMADSDIRQRTGHGADGPVFELVASKLHAPLMRPGMVATALGYDIATALEELDGH
jgi:hypothetical protein